MVIQLYMELKTKSYDRCDDFIFQIANFPFISADIPASPVNGVYISQLVRYSKGCAQYLDFLDRKCLIKNYLKGNLR